MPLKYVLLDLHQAALHIAAKNDHADVARVLLEHGADVNLLAVREPIVCVCLVLFVCNAVSTLLESACDGACTWGLCEGHVYDVRLLCVVYRMLVCCLLCVRVVVTSFIRVFVCS